MLASPPIYHQFQPHLTNSSITASPPFLGFTPRKELRKFAEFRDSIARIYPEPSSAAAPETEPGFDLFDRLPDSLLLLVFNKIGVVVRVDCVISDDESSSASSSSDKSRSLLVNLFRVVFTNTFKPPHALGQFVGPRRSSDASSLALLVSPAQASSVAAALSMGSGGGGEEEADQGGVTHHSPTQVLKNFDEIKFLRIELPSGELGIGEWGMTMEYTKPRKVYEKG